MSDEEIDEEVERILTSTPLSVVAQLPYKPRILWGIC
jgi:hypothetical protein